MKWQNHMNDKNIDHGEVHLYKGLIICTHTHKDHLNTMLGCPYCNHHMWFTVAWVKHVVTHHTKLPMFF